MAEAARQSETPKKDSKVDASKLESQIQSAMRSRIPHFKDQADSLTFEGVRRLLEKDLGLEAYALDVHKSYIKQCLIECLEGVGENDVTTNSGEAGEKGATTQEVEGSIEQHHLQKDVKDRCPEDEENMKDSPVLGLLKQQKPFNGETEGAKGNGKKVVPSEAIVKKAIRKRASYIKANLEKLSMSDLRRLLEEDLKLDKFTLDPHKKLISQQVLKSCEVLEPGNDAKKSVKNKLIAKATKKVSSAESSDALDQESDEDEVKPRKRSVPKGKMQNSVGSKKRKGPPDETNLSSKKRVKSSKAASEDNGDTEESGKNSEDDQSHSLPEKPTKKKEAAAPVYGKRVEHLKSVIKACGMRLLSSLHSSLCSYIFIEEGSLTLYNFISVPPSIYKKVKQVPENKRESQLLKELEEILSREGLSSNPSEKEIKDVRRKKERAKELEGIDVSNIVSSSRRRSTTSFAAPPKPKLPIEPNGNDAEDSDDSDDENDDKGNDDEEDDEDEKSDDDDDAVADDDNGSQSEEFNEDEEDSD